MISGKGCHEISRYAEWPSARQSAPCLVRIVFGRTWRGRKQATGTRRLRRVPSFGGCQAQRGGGLGAQFLGLARQRPPRGRPLTNRRWERSYIVKERQLTGLKRSNNQMAGSGRPPTVSTHCGHTNIPKAAIRRKARRVRVLAHSDAPRPAIRGRLNQLSVLSRSWSVSDG